MPPRRARWIAVAGVALASVGLVGAVVFQLQPWRTCPDDASPAECPMLPADDDAFLLFVLVLLAGCVALIASIVLRRADPRVPVHDRTPDAGSAGRSD